MSSTSQTLVHRHRCIHPVKAVEPFFGRKPDLETCSKSAAYSEQAATEGDDPAPPLSISAKIEDPTRIPEVLNFSYLDTGPKFARPYSTDDPHRFRVVFPWMMTAYCVRQDTPMSESETDPDPPSFHHAKGFAKHLLDEQRANRGPNVADGLSFEMTAQPGETVQPAEVLHGFALEVSRRQTEKTGKWVEDEYWRYRHRSRFTSRQARTAEEFATPYPGGTLDEDIPANVMVNESLRYNYREWVRGISQRYRGYSMGERATIEWDGDEGGFMCTLVPITNTGDDSIREF